MFQVFLDLFSDTKFSLVAQVGHCLGLSRLLFGFEKVVFQMGFKSLHEVGTVNLCVLINCAKCTGGVVSH